jgi:hypothetical protein
MIMIHILYDYHQSGGRDVTDDLRDRINALSGQTMASKLRKVMPDIDRKVREGVKHEDIVSALKEAGLKLSLTTFRTYFYRYRKSLGKPSDDKAPEQEDGNLFPTSAGLIQAAISEVDTEGFEAALDARQREATNQKYLGQTPFFFPKKGKQK